ncbi:uncharacterized protein BKCO1_7000054 [Diplodia corticola]|uniref:Uncharacterized protein n=1 Tax=Diplodia corticola TaxID=236234 RepID=A0A1J9RPT3_9PEZI|nr:uncharacterized protein BKCO1_7000054 [Diplodia corticola]OJD29924.1 hypothetical protein BKCO1_7000054 [Diplodia corticola]
MRFATIATPLLAAGLTATTSASPLPNTNTPRAGAPAYKPITPPCRVTDPLPATNATSDPTTAGLRPSASLTASHQLYSWDRPASDAAYLNASTLWTDCIEQCNGLSGCVSAFLAYDVPAEPRYGAPGGALGIACRMFDVAVAAADFAPVANGSYVRPVAGVIGGEGCGKGE